MTIYQSMIERGMTPEQIRAGIMVSVRTSSAIEGIHISDECAAKILGAGDDDNT